MIYFIFGNPEVLAMKTGTGLLFESLDFKCQLQVDELVTHFKDNNIVEKQSIYIGQQWLEVCRLNGGISFSDAQDGNIYVTDEAGNTLNLAPEIVYLLPYVLSSRLLNPYVIGYIDDYGESSSDCLFLANVKDNEFVYREDFFLHDLVLEKDSIYGYDIWTDSLKKLDYQLNDVWTFTPGSDSGTTKRIIPYKNTVVYHHGFGGVESLEEVPIPGDSDRVYTHRRRLDGELYCLDRETGEKRWERKFATGLNDMILHADKLYGVAENELYRLTPETGEIEHQVQMGYCAGGETELFKVLTVIDNKLWIQIDHWFYKTHCLLVVDLDTFAIEHKIDIPAPYAPDKFLHYDEAKRQVCYRLRFRYTETRVEHNHPLLVLNLDELDQPVTFEPRPEIDISFRPAADNKDLEELWIHIKDTPLHKALRFGIIETQNQTNVHGEMNRLGEGCRKTFNGRVHFRYSGSDRPKAEVEEQLKVIESSFNEWAQSTDVEAGTGSGEPVSIDVAYIE